MEDTIKHILIVEDDDLLRDQLSHAFSKDGFGVSTAQTGQEALMIALEKSPDFILLDLKLPKMSGFEMLRKLRAQENGKSIPVLILSNLKDQDSIAEAIEIGGCDYLTKGDWSLDDVLKKVKSKLE